MSRDSNDTALGPKYHSDYCIEYLKTSYLSPWFRVWGLGLSRVKSGVPVLSQHWRINWKDQVDDETDIGFYSGVSWLRFPNISRLASAGSLLKWGV